MDYGLALRASGAFDPPRSRVSSRPWHQSFCKAQDWQIHVSGGEFNVSANLSDCFELPTRFITAMVKYPVSDLIAGRVRTMGVIPFYKLFQHNGVTGPNLASVYSDREATAASSGSFLQPGQ